VYTWYRLLMFVPRIFIKFKSNCSHTTRQCGARSLQARPNYWQLQFWHLTHAINRNSFSCLYFLLLPAPVNRNIVMEPFSKQQIRWFCMALWLKWNLPGWWPKQSDVANAMVNAPQSQPPACICTSIKLTGISRCFVTRIAVIWHFRSGESMQ